jgi:DUF1680 family protein
MHPNTRSRSIFSALWFALSASALWPQSIQVQGASHYPGEQVLQPSAKLPEQELSEAPLGEVGLLPGLFRERRELTRAYVLRLKTENILQDYLLEAGARIDTPEDQLHLGWEAPSCQLRGHFAGHWLSAAAHFAAVDRDPIMAERAREVVEGLKRCQELNGGQWVGSIPDKYLAILADGREPIWSPQYTLHKTMMGLFDAYRFTHDREALSVLEHSADWFFDWTDKMIREGHGEAVYGGECAGMLELWANLYGETKDPRYLRLAARYAMPDLFRDLLAGRDPLTDNHANGSIPWIQGAARLYEVTGDERYRRVVEQFWKQDVIDRGMFATTGCNAGEYWIPALQFGRFLGSHTQEHCTVYNMIRVAQYLYRWTGDTRYADYIERALYNGILAQQNPHTGMVSYFLPLQPGAKKQWSTETRDFWCCVGTLVQAQAMYEDLIFYRARDGVTVSQFVPSKAYLGGAGQQIRITQTTDSSDDAANFTRPGDTTRFVVNLAIASDSATPWTLRVRQPGWAIGPGEVTVDGKPVEVSISKRGYIELDRNWTSSHVKIAFAKRVVEEALPGDPGRVALLDGPVVLAALTDLEPELAGRGSITPQYEHQYIEGRDWLSGHYLVRTARGSVAVVPLYEVADETYSVYFAKPL